MDHRTKNEKYAEIGSALIKNELELEYIRDSKATIIYLSSEHEMKKNRKITRGQCEKIPEKYKWAIPCDFTITIFEPNVENFTEDQMKVLIFHELLHIGIDVDGNEETYYVNPHDIEDFKTIIDRFGVDWSE